MAWNEEQLAEFPGIVERANANGYHAIAEVGVDELYRREPHLGPGAHGALEVPDEGLVCPFTTPLAYATEAVLAGCDLRRATPVTAVERLEPAGFRLTTPGGALRTRYLVNAAGLRSDEIDRMLGHDRFTVTPRRGELIVFDKLARPLVEHIVLAVPTKITKGVLVAPTVFGNVMHGADGGRGRARRPPCGCRRRGVPGERRRLAGRAGPDRVRATARWIAPNVVVAGAGAPPRGRFVLRSTSFVQRPRVEIAQAGRTLWSGRLRRLVPGRSAALPHAWTAAVDPDGGPVSVRVIAGG